MALRNTENPRERIASHVLHSRWMKAVSVMACIVVFCTTYALILPAITMSAQDANCGIEEHTHAGECYDEEGNLICSLQEHEHTLACYSDLMADIEEPAAWTADVPAAVGDRSADVYNVAKSQVGYKESDKNYLVSDGDQTQGYSRYGDWYSETVDGSGERLENGLSTYTYENWDAMFASFVLYNAGVNDLGYDKDAGNWAGALAAAGKYEDAADYTPGVGDLIFFTPHAGERMHVGIVTDVNTGFLGFVGDDLKSVTVILGDSNDAVEEINVSVRNRIEGDVEFETIHGYGILNPKEEDTEDGSVPEPAQDIYDANAAADGSLSVVLEPTSIPMDSTMEQDANDTEDFDANASQQEGTAGEAELPTEQTQTEDGASVDENGNPVVGYTAGTGAEDITKPTDDPQTGKGEITGGALLEDAASLSGDRHIIGKGEEDLDSEEEKADGSVAVTVSDAGMSEDKTTINMTWYAAAQLPETVLPAGALIRVDTASGKLHGMTASAASAWGGAATIGGESTVLTGNEAFEVTFIGDNDLLYSWDDVQAIGDASTVTFVGIHVKTLSDVEAADGTISLAFATTANAADVNAGQNYYVTKVSVNGSTGSAIYTYENGVAMPADQDRVLQDAGLDVVPEKTLTASGNDYTVTMTYGEDAGIPDIAKLKVREIVKGTDEYDNYIAEAKKALGITSDADTVLSGRFFDIKIMTKDGEFEPKAPVKVDIQYNRAEADVPVENVNTVHIHDEGSEKVASSVKGDGDALRGVNFEAESFSVYGIVYTVDFIYNGYTYYLDGDHQIYLSELLPILGINESVSDIKNVTAELIAQKDESVLDHEFYVEKTEDDWLLKSDAPFGNIYTLTVELDGRIYAITVKDVQESPDLVHFLDSITIDGAVQQSNGSYLVEKDKDFTLIAVFSEDSNYQFKNEAPLTYQMPTGIKIGQQQDGNLKINIKYNGRTYEVDATYNLTTAGKLTINFDQTDPDFHKLVQSTDVSFRFTYNAQFDGSSTELLFSSGVERTIEFDEPKPGGVYVSKTGNYDANTGKFTYTIKVKASGDVTNVNVKDQIVGEALIFNNNVSVTPDVDFTNNGSSNGFDYTFPSMTKDQEITITYSADTDFTKGANGVITYDKTKNTVMAKPDGGQPRYSEYGREIKFKYAEKSDGTITGTESNGDKIVEWSIEYNKERMVSAAGDLITDTIAEESRQYMTYVGKPTVYVYNENNDLIAERPDVSLQTQNDYSWTYKIPETDTGKYRYVIKYKTKVDMTKVNQTGDTVTLKNMGNGDSGTIGIEPAAAVTIKKTVESQTEQTVSWKVVIHVPAAGLSEAVLKDTIPSIWKGHLISGAYGSVYEQLTGAITYEGLLDGETAGDPEIHDYYFQVTFYQDAQKTKPGLKASDSGHDITIRYSTLVDPLWLAENYADPTDNTTRRHNNIAEINGKPSIATAQFVKTELSKLGPDEYKPATNDNAPVIQYPYSGDGEKTIFLRYELWITHPEMDNLTIEDKFDTSILKVADPVLVKSDKASIRQHMKIYGGTYPGETPYGESPVSYTETEDGVIINASVPKDADGNFYRHYKIVYYLQVKDGVDLEALAKAHGGDYEVRNTAKWGDRESEYTFTVKNEYLTKKLLNEGSLGGTNRIAQYQIVFNPDKQTLKTDDESRNTITLTDTLSSTLSVDYSSIKIVTDPENVSVPYSLRGNDAGETVATYEIPNSTKVTITYNALVVGSGSVTISNVASTSGRTSSTTNTDNYASSAEGTGDVAKLKIVKVDGYDASKKLQGVRFRFYPENSDLAFTSTGNVKELILTTDDKGEITIDGDQYLIYFNQKYYLQELEPKPGYGNISFPYQYTLTKDIDKVDYKHYIYYYNDFHQIKNWPLEGLVVEKQVESSNEQDLEKYFDFRVTVLNEDGSTNTAYNTENSSYKFENGVCNFKLKNKEQMMFWDMPVGTKYRVEEIGADGYSKSVTYTIYNADGEAQEVKTDSTDSHVGVLTQPNEVIRFKNTPNGTVTEIEGTKTWVDTSDTHTPPILTLTRKTNREGAAAETVKAAGGEENLQPTWEGNKYTYSNLPKYDDAGYEYTYEVSEAGFEVNGVTYTATKGADGKYSVTSSDPSASKYTTVQTGNDFINESPVNFDFTKVWTTGGNTSRDTWHDGKTIKVVLGRRLIPDDGTQAVDDTDFKAEYELKDGAVTVCDATYSNISAEANGTDYKFIIKDLPAGGKKTAGGEEKSGRWEYFISEQKDGDSYNVYYYEAGAQAENHTEESVKTGGTIQNDLRTYAFPQTGSFGTMPFMLGGSIISGIALVGVAILTWMERRRDG